MRHFAAFMHSIGDLVAENSVQSMGDLTHHTSKISCLDHCLFVSYLSFVFARVFGGDAQAAARGGLLHDLYLNDWSHENMSLRQHLLGHAERAANNAQALSVSKLETSIIYKHMWPVNFTRVPVRREEFYVNLADKICAIAEVTGLYWLLSTPGALRQCVPAVQA